MVDITEFAYLAKLSKEKQLLELNEYLDIENFVFNISHINALFYSKLFYLIGYVFENNFLNIEDKKKLPMLFYFIQNIDFNLCDLSTSKKIIQFLIQNAKNKEIKTVMKNSLLKDFELLLFIEQETGVEAPISFKIKSLICHNETQKLTDLLTNNIFFENDLIYALKIAIKYEKIQSLRYILDNFNFTQEILLKYTKNAAKSLNANLFDAIFLKLEKIHFNEIELFAFNNGCGTIFTILYDPINNSHANTHHYKNEIDSKKKWFSPSVTDKVNQGFKFITQKNKIENF